jgi:hypothetical protein
MFAFKEIAAEYSSLTAKIGALDSWAVNVVRSMLWTWMIWSEGLVYRQYIPLVATGQTRSNEASHWMVCSNTWVTHLWWVEQKRWGERKQKWSPTARHRGEWKWANLGYVELVHLYWWCDGKVASILELIVMEAFLSVLFILTSSLSSLGQILRSMFFVGFSTFRVQWCLVLSLCQYLGSSLRIFSFLFLKNMLSVSYLPGKV